MSCNIDKINFTDSLNTAREKINDVYTGSTQIWSGSTGFQSIVSRGDDTNYSTSDYSSVIGGVNNVIDATLENNIIIAGEDNTINGGTSNSAILGGSGNTITGLINTTIVAGQSITAEHDNSLYVERLITSGERFKNVRYITQEEYKGNFKRPVINDDDEIIFITDATTNDGALAYADYTIDLRNMTTQNRVGRTVDIIMINNSGFLGEILLAVPFVDWRINSTDSGIATYHFPCCNSNMEHIRLTYIGQDGSGKYFFTASGTGI